MFRLFLIFLASVLSLTSFCKVIVDGNAPDAFRINQGVRSGNTVQTPLPIYHVYGKQFPVDPTKRYRISGEFRVIEAAGPKTLLLGFYPLNNFRQLIDISHVLPAADYPPILTLAEDLLDGDSSVVLMGLSGRKITNDIMHLAFDAKADFSDMPNSKLSPRITKDSLRELGDKCVEISFDKPFSGYYPAGTQVRLHAEGPVFIYAAGSDAVNGTFQTFSGEVAGINTSRSINHSRWYPGTKFAEVTFRCYPEGGKLEFRNIKVEELD